jgi:SAM-dependent methyltransferase
MTSSTRSYDSVILERYRKEAEAKELSETSTMEDDRVRALETGLILETVSAILPASGAPVICEVGCGNGYTLSRLRGLIGSARLYGIEYTPELLALARSRFGNDSRVTLEPGDIRQPISIAEPADILISQRVVINLLDAGDQKVALGNLIAATKVGGYVLLVEAFQENLAVLNQARAEFDLLPLDAPYHNLYLKNDVLDSLKGVERMPLEHEKEHFLSTHYFVTRVLHAGLFAGKPFVRNSHFVRFFSEALKSATGTYSPIRCILMRRAG